MACVVLICLNGEIQTFSEVRAVSDGGSGVSIAWGHMLSMHVEIHAKEKKLLLWGVQIIKTRIKSVLGMENAAIVN